jgi:putative ABC transport system permease protein
MLLTVLGIALGVAVSVATALAIRTAHRAYRNLFEGVSGKASLEVAAPGFAGFDGGLATRVARLPGVKAAVPRIQVWAALAGPSGSVPALALGADPTGEAAGQEFPVRSGRSFQEAEGVWLGAAFAEAQGFKPGQAVRFWTPRGQAVLPLLGTLEPQGMSVESGGAMGLMTLRTAQRLFGLPGQINSIQIFLEDDVQPGPVQTALAAYLPAGLQVQPPGTRGELAQTTLLAAEQGLAALSLVALVAAAFVILNTVLLNLGERRRQLATLRMLGATPAQVQWQLLGEAVLLGIVGAFLGLGAGSALAVVLKHAMENFMGAALPGLDWDLGVIILALLLGPGTALAATYFPIRKAGRRQPLDELLGRDAGCAIGQRSWAGAVGIPLIALAAVLEVGLLGGWFRPSVNQVLLAPTVGLFLVGCTLLMPWVVPTLLNLISRALNRRLGAEGTLALRQVARQRTRTCLTAGVLFIAIAVAIGFGNTVLNTLRDLHQWYNQTIVADFFVRGSMPDTSFLMSTPLPESLADEMTPLAGAGNVEKLSFIPASAQGQLVLVLARTFAANRPLPLELCAGTPPEVRAGLSRGDVVVGLALAQRLGLGVGDRMTVQTLQGPQQLLVAGTAKEYASGGLTLYLEWDTAKRLLKVPGVHCYLVAAAEGEVPALTAGLRKFCGRRHLLLQTNDDLRAQIDGLLARVVGALWVLMALAFVVASLGIVNTLAMNVHDQRRELGVLRALGMPGRQIRKMVFLQALMTGLVSLGPGAGVGLGLAYLINLSTYPVLGQQAAFRVEVSLVAGSLVLALGIGVLAALIPAQRAARVRVMDTLRGS